MFVHASLCPVRHHKLSIGAVQVTGADIYLYRLGLYCSAWASYPPGGNHVNPKMLEGSAWFSMEYRHNATVKLHVHEVREICERPSPVSCWLCAVPLALASLTVKVACKPGFSRIWRDPRDSCGAIQLMGDGRPLARVPTTLLSAHSCRVRRSIARSPRWGKHALAHLSIYRKYT